MQVSQSLDHGEQEVPDEMFRHWPLQIVIFVIEVLEATAIPESVNID